MKFNYVIKDYYQKSRVLLYPLLRVRKYNSKPDGVYLFYKDIASIFNYELIVFFDKKNKVFQEEKDKIFEHKHLKQVFETENGDILIFNVLSLKEEVKAFLKGKYSKFPEFSKRFLRLYYGENIDNKEPLPNNPYHMIFYPEVYWEKVAEELNVRVDLLEEVYELWDKYNSQKENLNFELTKQYNNFE